MWQHIHSSHIKAEYVGSLCKILGICPQCSVLKLCFVCAKISLDIVRRLDLSLCMGLLFLSMGQQSGAFLVHTNLIFVDFNALLSLRFIFTSVCDKKMMITDVFSLTNPALIIFICSEGLFRGNKIKSSFEVQYVLLYRVLDWQWKPNRSLKCWVVLV